MKIKRRGLYEKVINIILDILIIMFGIILLISIYNNVQIKILGNKYSSFFGYSTFEVQTGSMADTINPGDWIIVKSTENIKLDDIITYSQKGEFITHRVVETYKDTFITKGDANNSKDDAITKSQIVGKVIKILPGFGIIRKTFFNPLVLFTSIITLYLVSYALRSASKNNNNPKERKINYQEKIDSLINYLLEKLINYLKNREKNNIESNFNREIDDSQLIELEEQFVSNDLKITIPEINKDDIDKTLYFRMVPVEKTELDNANIEIENNQIVVNDDQIKQYMENIEDNVIEEKVNLIQNKRKKFKNIIEKAIYFKKEEINEIIDILIDREKNQKNESTIKEVLLNAYIDGKYYNYCGNTNVEFNKKTVFTKIDTELKKVGKDLITSYKGSDKKYENKVNKYVDIFLLINSLEKNNISISDFQEKKEIYKNNILKFFGEDYKSPLEFKNMINQIIKTQKLYQTMINYILEKANTNTFNLELNKISGKKNMFAVSLEHNILFSKVYSEYIVDKTYTEGIIAEDKVMVLLNLLLTNVVRDMFDLEENKKYFIHIPNSIYMKPNKLDKIFKLFEDEYAKNNIIVVIEYKDLSECSKQVANLRKKGYCFAIVFDGETKINDDNQKFISVAEYLFIDKKIMNYNIISSIPNDLAESIINDDIMNKLSSFGGE